MKVFLILIALVYLASCTHSGYNMGYTPSYIISDAPVEVRSQELHQ